MSLLCAASASFGGPHDPPRVRDVLARLGRLIVRSQPGTDREVVGLFHPTLAEHLAEHARNRVDIGSGRRVLLEEIDKLAPVTGLYMDNPLYRWAAEAEAEQLWQLGMIGSALQSLHARPLPTPRENLARWRSWDARVRVRLGPDDENTLSTRDGIAYWTGNAGKAREALRLLQELLPDRERVLGPDHPGTLTTRGNIAFWTGETGKSAEALRLFQQLLPDRERVLGPDHPDTLTTRNNIAFWTSETGSAE
jgi:Tetratricopeptide repeat